MASPKMPGGSYTQTRSVSASQRDLPPPPPRDDPPPVPASSRDLAEGVLARLNGLEARLGISLSLFLSLSLSLSLSLVWLDKSINA